MVHLVNVIKGKKAKLLTVSDYVGKSAESLWNLQHYAKLLSLLRLKKADLYLWNCKEGRFVSVYIKINDV